MTFPAGSVLMKPTGLNIKIDDEFEEKGSVSERNERNPIQLDKFKQGTVKQVATRQGVPN
jgi:hypothetical protein